MRQVDCLKQPKTHDVQGSQPVHRKSANLAAAPLMGMGCTAIVERMAASVGKLAGVQRHNLYTFLNCN